MKKYIKFKTNSGVPVKQNNVLGKPLEQRLSEMPTAASAVLAVIAVAGLTTMALIAPNSLQVLKLFMHRKSGKNPTPQEVEKKFLQTVYYLKKTGKIQLTQDKESFWVKLGKLTKRDKQTLEIDTVCIPKPKQWDGAFWLVAADIPTKTHRSAADAFRSKLVSLGFYPLQRTLWLHPYDPTTQLQVIIDYFKIGRFVTLMHVDKLDTQDKALAVTFWKHRKMV